MVSFISTFSRILQASLLSNVNPRMLKVLIILSFIIIMIVVVLGGWRDKWSHRTYRGSTRRYKAKQAKPSELDLATVK